MVGVYDSGFGGLGVLGHLRAALPHADWVYLGDSGRAPYGGRDAHTILDFAELAVERLFAEGCSVVIVACNTVSCVALRHLQQRTNTASQRVLGVTIPGAEVAVRRSAGHIGILATQRTVASGTYVDEIAKLGPHRVTQRAAPLLAPLVEEGWEDSEIARLAVGRYLRELPDIDTLLLGCTHYPHLMDALVLAVPAGVTVVDPAPFVAERAVDWFARHPSFDPGTAGTLRVLCTGDPDVFARHGARFLGTPLPPIEHIAALAADEVGQVVRSAIDAPS